MTTGARYEAMVRGDDLLGLDGSGGTGEAFARFRDFGGWLPSWLSSEEEGSGSSDEEGEADGAKHHLPSRASCRL